MPISFEMFTRLDEKEASRLKDYLEYHTIEQVNYVSLCSWMALHECCHIGEGDVVEDLYKASLIDDTSCDFETGLRIFGFDRIEPMQTIESLCGASHYSLDKQSQKYERFDPGFPENPPSIKEQVTNFLENNPGMAKDLKQSIEDEKKLWPQNNLNFN
ncbi:MAG: hypothetical protein JWM96_888 [Alphaproteobacteria bacterium]|nr:hypothetical protein [Alphaproteobacteria bacterium]